jgi:hypothetical protein
MKTTKLLVCAVAVSTAIAAVSAQGQSLTATLNGINPGLTYEGTWNGSFIFDYPAGVMNFTEVGTGLNFSAFCVQPLEDIAFGETLVYDIQSPTSLGIKADIVARLIGAYLSAPASDQTAAAVQWAIWEVTTETTPVESLFDGTVRIIDPAGSSTATLANQYLANYTAYSPVALTYLSNPTRQDVVTWNVVPEPTTAGLAVLSGLLLLRRRRA